MEREKTQDHQYNIEGEEQGWSIHTTPLQDNSKTTIITSVVLLKEKTYRPIEQNREHPEIDPHIYSQPVFDKGAKAT